MGIVLWTLGAVVNYTAVMFLVIAVVVGGGGAIVVIVTVAVVVVDGMFEGHLEECG